MFLVSRDSISMLVKVESFNFSALINIVGCTVMFTQMNSGMNCLSMVIMSKCLVMKVMMINHVGFMMAVVVIFNIMTFVFIKYFVEEIVAFFE